MITGRLFGETLSGRYADTDVIDNPIMLLEYIKRNQSWQDTGGAKLIRTGSESGSFDSTYLDEIRAFGISRQIFNKAEQYTDAISKSICEEFYLVSRQDSDGYECVEYIFSEETPSVAVDIGDTVPGSIGMIEGPNQENIIVMPEINYHYDNAFLKYRKKLSVIGVDTESAWNSDLTPGFTEADGEEVWNSCKALYDKYKVINLTPSNISDTKWVCEYDAALWKIKKVIEYQGFSRFSFSVPYSIGRTWYPGKKISITFPNETNNNSISSLIVKILKSKNRDSVAVNVLLTETIPTEFYSILLQMDDSAGVEWQENDGGSEYQEA